jgi:hypothetical protein
MRVDNAFPPESKFSNIKLELSGSGSTFFKKYILKMYDVNDIEVNDESKAFKIVVSKSNLNTIQISAIISAVCFVLIGGFFAFTNMKNNSGLLGFTSTQLMIIGGVVGSILLGGFILSNMK